MAAFAPKQMVPFDAKLFQIVGAPLTEEVGYKEISIIQDDPKFAISDGAIIHDAACGTGSSTIAILKACAGKSVTLHATDLKPPMADIYNLQAQKEGWPTKAVLMDCEKLDFPDESFTHTFLSFGLPVLENPAAGAKEMYRTLKPGGTAVTAFWLDAPGGELVAKTRRKVWGENTEMFFEPHKDHKDPEFVPGLLKDAGFKGEIVTREFKAVLPVNDLDEYAAAMWTAVGAAKGGWTQEDEDRWDEAISTYKDSLTQDPSYKVDTNGKISLDFVAQIVIVKK